MHFLNIIVNFKLIYYEIYNLQVDLFLANAKYRPSILSKHMPKNNLLVLIWQKLYILQVTLNCLLKIYIMVKFKCIYNYFIKQKLIDLNMYLVFYKH